MIELLKEWMLLVSLLVSIPVAVAGWVVAHRLAVERDQILKRQNVRVEHLLSAYGRLESSFGPSESSSSPVRDQRAFECAIADIQLLGSQEQADLAKELALNIASNRGAALKPILESLRSELRRELGLPEAQGSLFFFRFSEEGQDRPAPRGDGSVGVRPE